MFLKVGLGFLSMTKRLRMRNRKQGLGGVTKIKTTLVQSNRGMFQEVPAARGLQAPKLHKVGPVVKKVENNNITFADVHHEGPKTNDDKKDFFLEGVPAVNHAQDLSHNLLANFNFEDQYESASSAI